ncbi:MAG TPA: bifunctional class I SAM-dependent methyltransferase/glycosyltransferase family 2 protein [Gaiellaceae bacterium]
MSSTLDPGYAGIVDAFDELATDDARWSRRTRGYHDLITAVNQSIVQPNASVLEIGSGGGDLLAALAPARGVGVDVSSNMVELARTNHPHLRFEVGAGEDVEIGETFDYVVLSDLLPFVHDLLGLFSNVRRHSHRDTRIVVHSYSQLWRPTLRLLERLRLKRRTPMRNWVTAGDVENFLQLSGLESVTTVRRILLPVKIPILSTFCNGFLANLWIIRHLCLTYWIVARVQPGTGDPPSVSVVVPAKNEAGMIERIVDETPELGSKSELIFVEGHSNDGTADEIRRQIELHPEREIRYIEQSGNGKGDAVRLAFEQARNDVLIILDADLTVRPSALPSFIDALETGRAEFVNGSRLVYDLEPGAMRFLNILGNKWFSVVFSALLDQPVKDTLCGTKAIERRRYEQIAAGRSYFGDFDPFGDFDLLLGAARLNLKIVDLPVRYHARTYGDTKISRFRHGWLLIYMAMFAFWKLKVEVFRLDPNRSKRR